MNALGITGTDTSVGKTVISAALVTLLRRRGAVVGVMKPVETGRDAEDPASDAALLRAMADNGDALDLVRPILLPEPLAPWIAASRAGIPLDLDVLDHAYQRIAAGRDAVLVEGAGGLLVPITRGTTYATLFARWGLDAVLVAGNRLGVLNHALLTVQVARANALHIRGVVLNTLHADAQSTAEQSNLDALRDLLYPLPIFSFPWLASLERDALADAAETAGLGALLDE